MKYSRIAGILFFFFTSLSAQTSIVAIATEGAVYLGADSKVVSRDATGRITTTFECKIHRQGDFYFAFSGIYRWSGYRGETHMIGPYVQGILSAIEMIVSPKPSIDEVGRIVAKYLSDNPTHTQLDSLLVVELVALFPTDSSWTTYFVRASLNGIDSSATFHGKTPPVLLGEKQLMTVLCRNAPGLVDSIGAAETINYLIASQAAATPTHVGGPISILRVDRTGPAWIQKGIMCPEQLESFQLRLR